MRTPGVSIVIPTRNEGDLLAFTVYSILQTGDGVDFEIIVIDDGSTDGSVQKLFDLYGRDPRLRIVAGERQGPGRARNLGARLATGHYVLFIDAHCETPPGWLQGMLAPLADSSVGMVGCGLADLRDPSASPGGGAGCTWGSAALDMVWLSPRAGGAYDVPLLPGGCQALRRDDFLSFAYYDLGMSHIGSEGEDQALRCWLMGYRVLVEPRVVVRHLFRTNVPYAVNAGKLIYNRLRIAFVHFSPERCARVVDALKNLPQFSEQLLELAASDALQQRASWAARRKASDDWFFETFRIPA
jgi:glycosyltransferase involved in cell wall biosynthesis